MAQNKKEIQEYLKSILDLEEFYLVEDYSIYFKVKNSVIIGSNNSSKKIRLIRLMVQYNSSTSMEDFVYKCNIDTIFEHLKIYEPNKKNFINIYVKREESNIYDGRKILEKINRKSFLRPIFLKNLKIKEFPLKKYSLEQINNDGKSKYMS